MALNLTRFRTRSPERDRAADQQRTEKVRTEILSARASAVDECKGLEKRIQSYLLQATMLLDNSEDYASRTPADELEISQFESRAEAGRARVKIIQHQIETFDRMLQILESASPNATAVLSTSD